MKEELLRVEQEAAELRKIEVDGANAEKQKYIERYIHENQLRKKIHNKLLEIQGMFSFLFLSVYHCLR